MNSKFITIARAADISQSEIPHMVYVWDEVTFAAKNAVANQLLQNRLEYSAVLLKQFLLDADLLARAPTVPRNATLYVARILKCAERFHQQLSNDLPDVYAKEPRDFDVGLKIRLQFVSAKEVARVDLLSVTQEVGAMFDAIKGVPDRFKSGDVPIAEIVSTAPEVLSEVSVVSYQGLLRNDASFDEQNVVALEQTGFMPYDLNILPADIRADRVHRILRQLRMIQKRHQKDGLNALFTVFEPSPESLKLQIIKKPLSVEGFFSEVTMSFSKVANDASRELMKSKDYQNAFLSMAQTKALGFPVDLDIGNVPLEWIENFAHTNLREFARTLSEAGYMMMFDKVSEKVSSETLDDIIKPFLYATSTLSNSDSVWVYINSIFQNRTKYSDSTLKIAFSHDFVKSFVEELLHIADHNAHLHELERFQNGIFLVARVLPPADLDEFLLNTLQGVSKINNNWNDESKVIRKAVASLVRIDTPKALNFVFEEAILNEKCRWQIAVGLLDNKNFDAVFEANSVRVKGIYSVEMKENFYNATARDYYVKVWNKLSDKNKLSFQRAVAESFIKNEQLAKENHAYLFENQLMRPSVLIQDEKSLRNIEYAEAKAASESKLKVSIWCKLCNFLMGG